MSEKQNSENLLREVLFIVFANKRLVIDVAVFFLVLVIGVAFLAPKQYTAQATLLVKGKRVERNPELIEQMRERRGEITLADLNSEAEIIASVEVLKATVIKLSKQGLVFSLPEDNPTSEIVHGDYEKELVRQASRLSKKLGVNVVRASQVLELSLIWGSRRDSERILATLVNEYLRYRDAVYKPERAQSFYSDTVLSYQQKLDGKSSELANLMEKIKATNASVEIESNLGVKKDYQLKLGSLEQQRLSLHRELSYLQSQLKDIDNTRKANITWAEGSSPDYRFFVNLDNAAVREIANSLHMKLEQYRTSTRHFLPTSQRVLSQKAELDNAYNLLLKEVRSLVAHKQQQLSAVLDTIQYLKKQVAELDTRNSQLAHYDIELDRLKREKRLLEQSYTNYYRLREEAQMFERTQDAAFNTHILVLAPAWANPVATFPNKRLLLPFGIFVAMLMALTAAFINEYFDDTFKRPVDSSRYLDLPVLASFSDKAPSQPKAWSQILLSKLLRVPAGLFSRKKSQEAL